MSPPDDGPSAQPGQERPEPGRPGRRRPDEPVDPDVDLHVPAQRVEAAGGRMWAVLAAVSVGGALGSCARYALSLALPAGGSGFPWGTFAANVLGCALIGVLMVLVSEGGRAVRAHPLARPFLGVGVLGGFTTFSAYAADSALLSGREAAMAVVYLGGTLLGALCAVAVAATATRAVLARRKPRRPA